MTTPKTLNNVDHIIIWMYKVQSISFYIEEIMLDNIWISNHFKCESTRKRDMCPMYGPVKSKCNDISRVVQATPTGVMALAKELANWLSQYMVHDFTML